MNYFRDQVPHMTEMVQPLRKLIDIKKYKGSKKLTWAPESMEAFHFCRIAVSNCKRTLLLRGHYNYCRQMHLITASVGTSVNHPPKRRGYCDTVVRNGTPCTGTVRTCTSRTSGQPPFVPVFPHPSILQSVMFSLVIVYTFTITTIIISFTSCDATILILQQVARQKVVETRS